jgi:acyl-CoA thioesterase FadM
VYRAADRAHRATGSLTVVSVDKPTMKPRQIPDDVREKLSLYAG